MPAEEQVRPLLPGDGASRALITARRPLAGLEGVRRLVLGPLSPPEATGLLFLDRDKFAADVPARLAAFMADAQVPVTETPGSHAVFVSRPAVVAAVISQAAQG